MNSKEYLQHLINSYEVYYDVAQNFTAGEIEFDLYARYFERNERYFATKKIVLYGLERNEHMLYKHYPVFTLEDAKNYTAALEKVTEELVKPGTDHMSTLVRGVVSTEEQPSKEVIAYLEKYKFYKSFLFGLHGWVHVGLNLVNINDSQHIYHNKMGKEGREIFSI